LVVVNSVCDRDSSIEDSLDEATEYFVVFKFYWFSLDLLASLLLRGVSFGSSQKKGEKTFLQSHDYYSYLHKNVFDLT